MYSVIDIESNGAGYRQESIIEIAIYRYDGHEITDQFISLVNPEAEISTYVQKLTGITPKMVKSAPKFHELAKRVVEITNDSTLVGHNIDFDYRMLRQSFKRLGYEFKINTLDTIPLAKKLIPEAESYSLGKLVKSLGIPLTEQHRAGGDARATLDLLKLLISKDTQNEIIQKQYEETNAHSYVNRVRNLTQDLPNERGIIYFQTADGQILLTDFVDDINRFAKKLFNSKSNRYKAVQEHCEQIHFEPVGNFLVAKLIMKSKGIRRRESLPFGLFYKNEKFVAEKNTLNENDKPLLRFSAFTQAVKALNFIKNSEEFSDFETFQNRISLEKRSEIWSLKGRTLGEKTFLRINNGKVKSFGFYEYHTQIQSKSKISKLQIKLTGSTADLENDLQLALLKNEVEIYPLPEK